ncbi:MAG: exodeoxyribonuclease III [Porticoccus sp.]
MRIISLAVDGIHQASRCGLFQWLASQEANIICLQDLRAQSSELTSNPEFELEGYFSYFFDSPTQECNGVAIYSREIPKAIMYGFGASNAEDMNGRYLQADFEHVSVCSLLAPNVTADSTTMTSSASEQEIKDHFFRDLLSHLNKISHKRREYVICGNWNIAHRDIDVSDPDHSQGTSGFLPNEQQCLDQLYQNTGYADAFRLYNTDADEFNNWPSGEQDVGCGWRTDLQVVSQGLIKRIEYAAIYKAKFFSSHSPVIIDYDLENL